MYISGSFMYIKLAKLLNRQHADKAQDGVESASS